MNRMLLCVSAGVKLWSQQVCRHCGGHRATKDPRTLPTQADAGGRLAGTYRSHFRQSNISNYLIKREQKQCVEHDMPPRTFMAVMVGVEEAVEIC